MLEQSGGALVEGCTPVGVVGELMKARTLYFAIALSSILGCYGPGLDEGTRIAHKTLYSLTEWFITEGIGDYHAGRITKKDIFDRVYASSASVNNQGGERTYRGDLYIDEPISQPEYNYVGRYHWHALFFVNYWWIGYRTICCSRVYTDRSGIYEYWVVKWSSRQDVVPQRGILFIITHAEKVDSKREIVRIGEKYIERYELPENKYISVPNDPEMDSKITPELYPEAFKGTAWER
jgi:hypothetical protein